MTEPNKFTGMRAENDGDRSPEFKDERNRLVTNVNEWLVELARKRDAGESLANGLSIMDKPRIVRSTIGRVAANVNLAAEEKSYGVSLIGDGITSRLELQAVTPTADGKGIDTVEVTGSDPLEKIVTSDEYTDRGYNVTDVSFRMTEEFEGEQATYFGYEVSGSGAVRQKFVDHRGVNRSVTVRTVEDMRMASQSFEQVKAAVS